MPSPAHKSRHRKSGSLRIVLLWVLTTGISLSLNWSNAIKPIPGGHDNLKYVEMAHQIIQGEWLGRFTYMTLIRPPIYPLFLAAANALDVQMNLLQQMLYLVALLPLLVGLSRVGIGFPRLAFICILASFHPGALYPATLTYSEALYTPAMTALAAAFVGLVATARKSPSKYLPWLLLFWVALPVLWNTKDEAVWLVPFLSVWVGLLAMELLGKRPAWEPRRAIAGILLLLAVPIGASWSFNHWVRSQNLSHYGIEVVTELHEPQFERAMKSLIRLAPDTHRPNVMISSSGLDTAYGLSSEFARVEPYLSGEIGAQGWSWSDCTNLGLCDGLPSSVGIWAIRQGVKKQGYHESAKEGSEFYGRLADTVTAACDAGEVPCSAGPIPSIFAPPLRPSYVVDWAKASLRMLTMMLTMRGLESYLDGIRELSNPRLGILATYAKVTHQTDFDWHYAPGFLTRYQLWLYAVLQTAGLFFACLALLVGRSTNPDRTSRLWPWLNTASRTVLLAFLVLIANRVVFLGYVDGLAFPAQVRYFLVIYPVLLVLIGLGLPKIASGATARRR